MDVRALGSGKKRLGALALMAGLVLSGCSSNGVNSGGGSPVTTTASTMTPVTVTDAPSDQVLSLGLTVTGIRMYDAGGNYADVLTTPANLEALHLDAQQEPLRAPLNIPQDTYTSAVITVSNPTVTYVDPSTKTVVKNAAATLAAATTTVTFSAPIVVGKSSAPIVFDLLVGPSVAITGSGTSASVTVTPTFNVAQVSLAANPTQPGNGLNNGVVGTVVSVSGANLVLQQPNGQQITVGTTSATVFQGFSSLASLTAGEVVDVDLAHQSTGTPVAVRIHLDAAVTGTMIAGPVTAVTGTPATSFALTARQVVGASAAGVTVGSTVTVAVNGSTQFVLAPQVTNLPNLPFTPSFTASTLSAGQNVGVVASAVAGSATAPTATATAVTLLPQTVEGTIASVTTASGVTTYVVTLPSGSALGTLAGVSTVTVYEPASAVNASSAGGPAVGASVRVNGLLFNDKGTLWLVGMLRCDPAGAPPPQHH